MNDPYEKPLAFSQRCDLCIPKHYPVMAIPEPLEAMLRRLELNCRRARKAKWRKGRVMKSLDELYEQRQVYWHSVFYHCFWFRSWQLRYAKSEIDKGNIRLCLPRKECRATEQ